jgi:hypothetical protein
MANLVISRAWTSVPPPPDRPRSSVLPPLSPLCCQPHAQNSRRRRQSSKPAEARTPPMAARVGGTSGAEGTGDVACFDQREQLVGVRDFPQIKPDLRVECKDGLLAAFLSQPPVSFQSLGVSFGLRCHPRATRRAPVRSRRRAAPWRVAPLEPRETSSVSPSKSAVGAYRGHQQ